MQKILAEMNVQLDLNISAIKGKTGERVVKAIVAGPRIPGRLAAALRDTWKKASADTLVASPQ